METKRTPGISNWNIKQKIVLIFVVLFVLLLNLSAINITSVLDIQSDTQRIAETHIPRLIETSEIKDRLNSAVLNAYDYVQTGNAASKTAYEEQLRTALLAQIRLFNLASSDADFEFTDSFQDSINTINSTLTELVNAYESGASDRQIDNKLNAARTAQTDFAQFLEDEVEEQVRLESLQEREATQARVRNTIINVAFVVLIAFIAAFILYRFINRSITTPVQELTRAARKLGQGEFEYVQIDSHDELGVFAETFNTMTQRVKASQVSLEIELEKTKQLDRQKTEFLSIAAHQLRTPMSGIKWAVNMAASGDLGDVSDEAKEQLGKTGENIDRMVALINQLLNVTEIEAKGMHIESEPTPVRELVGPVVEEFAEAAHTKHITLSLQTAERAFLINADTDKMQMVLRNLVDNAIKYTPDNGTVTVRIEADASNAHIVIADTGMGIPETERDRIFSKFYRGSNVQTVQADGSGLGLYIAQQIVELHNGELSFDSQEGSGTTFTITLPLV